MLVFSLYCSMVSSSMRAPLTPKLAKKRWQPPSDHGPFDGRRPEGALIEGCHTKSGPILGIVAICTGALGQEVQHLRESPDSRIAIPMVLGVLQGRKDSGTHDRGLDRQGGDQELVGKLDRSLLVAAQVGQAPRRTLLGWLPTRARAS